MNRREFIQGTLLTAAAAGGGLAAEPDPGRTVEPSIGAGAGARIDTNVTLFLWPGRRLPLDERAALQAKLRQHGITEAWAGSFESVLHRDLTGVNLRLAEACRDSGGFFRPFGAVNVTLPAWEDDVRECQERHRMPGIRLYPNYHGYSLADSRFKRLMGMAAERGLLVQVVCLVEDVRTQSAHLIAPDVDLAPLPAALAGIPNARVLLLNSGKIAETPLALRLAGVPGIAFDTARVESTGAVARLIRRLPPGRVVFGSHAPYYIFESAVIKLFESRLTDAEIRALVDTTPRALLPA